MHYLRTGKDSSHESSAKIRTRYLSCASIAMQVRRCSRTCQGAREDEGVSDASHMTFAPECVWLHFRCRHEAVCDNGDIGRLMDLITFLLLPSLALVRCTAALTVSWC
jgi:hypothetical protein